MKAPEKTSGSACLRSMDPFATKKPVAATAPPTATMMRAALASRSDLIVSELSSSDEVWEMSEAATMPRMSATIRPIRAIRETRVSRPDDSSESEGPWSETACWLPCQRGSA